MKLNVAIGFVTGRKHFQNVLRSYINNWLEHGLIQNKDIRLHLFIAYDLKYHGTEIHDYKNIPPELYQMVDSVNFYGTVQIENEISLLTAAGMTDHKNAKLIFGEGYGKKRNAVTYFAIKKKMDRLIFIDDDEYPIATMKNSQDKLVWMGQSVAGTHLKNIQDADITHGHHCGYISPIPSVKFNHVLTEHDFKNFIESISNDIISWEKIKRIVIENNGVTYADKDIVNEEKVYEVQEESGMKFISGANLCFNLENYKALPPFYNPPGARGEDTFMSTALTNLKVLKVPCYTFHDGFMTYNNLLNGVLPLELEAININAPGVLKRFIHAAIGWIRYKPLLVYITNRENFENEMAGIEKSLAETIPKLCAYFKSPDFEKIIPEFKYYRKHAKKHFQDFEATKNAWHGLLDKMS